MTPENLGAWISVPVLSLANCLVLSMLTQFSNLPFFLSPFLSSGKYTQESNIAIVSE